MVNDEPVGRGAFLAGYTGLSPVPDRTFGLLVGALVLLLFGLAVMSLALGVAHLGWRDMAHGLIDGQGTAGIIMREIRLPRLLLSLLIGFNLGLCGASMQGLLRNPLAEPAVFGAPQAAALGAVIVLYSGLADATSFALPFAAILGAFVSVGLILLVAGRSAGVVTLILAGLAIASLCAAATSLVINLSPNPFAVTEIVFWLMGSFEDRSFRHVLIVVPFIVLSSVLLMAGGRGYKALTLGEETAASLGVDVSRLGFIIVFAVALGVGAGVAVCGAIGFVGLVAPHLVRHAFAGDPQRILLPSALAGASLLTGADILVRLIPSTSEIKVGVVTALLGVPLFLYLIMTRRVMVDDGQA
jgi:iron complex transport system permease protein